MLESTSITNENQVILQRLKRELADESSVALGRGLPRELKRFLQDKYTVVEIDDDGCWPERVGIVVIEAEKIFADGGLVVSGYHSLQSVNGSRIVVATRHERGDGGPKFMADCQSGVTYRGFTGKVITQLGVIEVTDIGLVLTEVAPGIATDEVKIRTGVSLHVADDIRVMELWD